MTTAIAISIGTGTAIAVADVAVVPIKWNVQKALSNPRS